MGVSDHVPRDCPRIGGDQSPGSTSQVTVLRRCAAARPSRAPSTAPPALNSRAEAGSAQDQPIGLGQRACRREALMVHRVVGDLVARVEDASHDRSPPRRLLADLEEGRGPKRRRIRSTPGVSELGPSSNPIAIRLRPRGPWVWKRAPRRVQPVGRISSTPSSISSSPSGTRSPHGGPRRPRTRVQPSGRPAPTRGGHKEGRRLGNEKLDPDRAGARPRDAGPIRLRERGGPPAIGRERQNAAAPAGARADTQLRGAASLAELQAEKRLGDRHWGNLVRSPRPRARACSRSTRGARPGWRSRAEARSRSAGVHRVWWRSARSPGTAPRCRPRRIRAATQR